MKQEYPRYGTSTVDLEGNLSPADRDLLDKFLQFCAVTACPDRLWRYRRYLLHFRDVVEKPLDQITKEDAIAFWGLVRNSPYEEHTKIAIKKSVKRFLRWHYRDLNMIECLQIPSNYFVNRARVNKSTLISADELQRMLHRAEKLRDKALLVLLYETAARPQEVRELKWREINWQQQEVHLYSRKTGEDRDLPLNESLKHLKRWKEEWVFPDPQPDDYIFPSIGGAFPDRRKPICTSYVNRIMKSLARKAGIERRISTYLLRHTRLTEVRRLGVQGVEFNKFAGHAQGSRQEAVYVHLDNADMKRSVLEKVYRVSDEETKTAKYEQRIEALEQQLREVLAYLRESRQVLAATKDNVELLDKAVQTT